jgi:hypothetical protein
MAEPKTKATDQNPEEFLSKVEPEQKRRTVLPCLNCFRRLLEKKL